MLTSNTTASVINSLKTADASAHPAGPFTIEGECGDIEKSGIDRFADAAYLLAALRNNQPQTRWTLLDADGYIVPSCAIKGGLLIKMNEAENIMRHAAAYADSCPAA